MGDFTRNGDPVRRLRWVYETVPSMSFAQRAVLAYIAWRHGTDRGCDVSTARMARELCADRATVVRALSVLVEMGYLSRESNPGKPSTYRLNPMHDPIRVPEKLGWRTVRQVVAHSASGGGAQRATNKNEQEGNVRRIFHG